MASSVNCTGSPTGGPEPWHNAVTDMTEPPRSRLRSVLRWTPPAGLALVPLYFRDHGGAAMPEGGFDVDSAGEIVLTGAVVQHAAGP